MSNPFRPPETMPSDPASFTYPRLIDWSVWILPVLMLLSIYATWLAGWLSLGRLPLASVDDPREIAGVLMRSSLFLSDFLCKFLPLTFVAGLIFQLALGGVRFPLRVVFAAVSIGAAAIMFAILFWDPVDAWKWFT